MKILSSIVYPKTGARRTQATGGEVETRARLGHHATQAPAPARRSCTVARSVFSAETHPNDARLLRDLFKRMFSYLWCICAPRVPQRQGTRPFLSTAAVGGRSVRNDLYEPSMRNHGNPPHVTADAAVRATGRPRRTRRRRGRAKYTCSDEVAAATERAAARGLGRGPYAPSLDTSIVQGQPRPWSQMSSKRCSCSRWLPPGTEQQQCM
jgi:hypothetical protein